MREQRISIILPAVRAPALTRRAIASIAAQTHPNWEIVVVDHVPISLEELLAGDPAWERITYLRPPLPVSAGPRAKSRAAVRARRVPGVSR